ncbi:hypothetical protein U1Q18_039802, partial [Sarracenia purpurea var. burkii]
MPLEGSFIEPSSNPVPDLSLHIRPPNSSSSSSSPSIRNTTTAATDLIEVDTGFDLLSRRDSHKSNNNGAFNTELSLAHPANALAADGGPPRRGDYTGGGAEEPPPPRNPYHHHHQQHHHHQRHQNHYLHQHQHHHPATQLNHINHGVSLLDVSDGLRPIKGIPVYHNRTFPFLPLDQTRDHRDPKMPFYQMSYPPWPSSSSSTASSSSSPSSTSLCSSFISHQPPPQPSSSPYFGTGTALDPMSSILNSAGPNASSSSPYRIAGAGARFTGFSPSYHQLHHHYHNQYGVGASHETSHAMMRSRFMPKLPTKRSMRAPRMRWTSTLHARFVHAVELLGGHE